MPRMPAARCSLTNVPSVPTRDEPRIDLHPVIGKPEASAPQARKSEPRNLFDGELGRIRGRDQMQDAVAQELQVLVARDVAFPRR